MRPYTANPFLRQQSELRFNVNQFLKAMRTFPLEAKARLQAAVADGSVSFPRGTCARTDYKCVTRWGHPQGGTDPRIEDLSLLDKRYTPLLALPSETLERKGFPYSFVLELLDKVAAGEHPAFVEGAYFYITAEFDAALWPESDSDPVDIAFA